MEIGSLIPPLSDEAIELISNGQDVGQIKVMVDQFRSIFSLSNNPITYSELVNYLESHKFITDKGECNYPDTEIRCTVYEIYSGINESGLVGVHPAMSNKEIIHIVSMIRRMHQISVFILYGDIKGYWKTKITINSSRID